MVCYLDSSLVLRWIFKSPNYYKQFDKWEKAASSVLLEVECHRTIDRLRLEGILDDTELADCKNQLESVLNSVDIIDIDSEVLQISRGQFPTVVKSLDAIHLATAILWQQEYYPDNEITILTHDKQMNTAARAFGFRIM